MQRQGIELNISQKQTLALTPQLLQAIRILGMTSAELEAMVKTELESNPALEAAWEKEPGRAEYPGGYGISPDEVSCAGDQGMSLSNFLLEQLTAEDLSKISDDSEKAYILTAWIAENLDESGFLSFEAAEIAAAAGAEEKEVRAAIAVLQMMEPPGIAASGARESLILQYERACGTNPLVIEIIETHLEDVASRSEAALARTLGRKRREIEQAIKAITMLDPKPGRGFHNGAETQYIIPDLIIGEKDGGFEVIVNNSYLPALTLSPAYRKMLCEADKGSETYTFLVKRLNAAAAIIKNLERREQTLYKTMAAILRFQHAYFKKGKQHLKPMALKQIAEEVGVHESTVSRAIRGKYVQTPHGVVEMKRFFGYGVKTADGEGAAAESIKIRISNLVGSEDKKTPLSDMIIAERLEKDGIFISRRTVAKYRREAGIPSSDKRKCKGI